MNLTDIKKIFDEQENVKSLIQIQKTGNSLERMEAKARYNYAWSIWQQCWTIAIKCYINIKGE